MITDKILLVTSLASSFMDSSCFSAVGTNNQSDKRKPDRPNIVLIMADDMGYGDIGCYGNKSTRTPFIDKMASEGMRFTDYHSNGAVSTPTRAALLTGNYQQRTGLEGVIYQNERDYGLEQKEITIAEVFKENSYSTGIFGKWHLGFPSECNPVKQGFDEFFGFLSGNVDYISHRDGSNMIDWWHDMEKINEEGYATDLITDHALKFIERKKEEHFFLYLAYPVPHSPYQSRDNLPTRVQPGSKPEKSTLTNETRKETYREMIEIMDENIGRVFQKLSDNGLDRKTFVFFCSDNGALSFVGSNGNFAGEKGTLYEGGHRVPAIAWFPGKIAPGTVNEELIMSMDLFPTLLSVAGISKKPGTDGIDVSNVFFKNKQLPSRTVFWRARELKAVRNGTWKYLESAGKNYLFNLDNDPGEKNNLILNEGDKANRLKKELSDWESSMSKYVQLFKH